MWFDLPAGWIVALNVVGVPAIHFGISWLFTRMDRSHFDPDGWLFRERPWERGGSVYQRLFRVRAWKHRLPDAAPWFGGFAKRHLGRRDPDHWSTFVVETCRGEAAHHVQVAALSLTVAWNPWPWAAGFMVFYALASNLPCAILQRFTRARLRQLLDGKNRGA